MSIHFNEKTRQFLLHTKSFSYVMELYEGCLAHVYWGKRVNEVPALDVLYPYHFGTDTSATDLPGRRFHSTDKLPHEYPTFGSADLRSPALHVRQESGNTVTRLRYVNHKIQDGKPVLAGLPATYGDDCQTLSITLCDPLTGLNAVLHYTIFPEKDVLTRSVQLVNRGASSLCIEKAASFSMDLYEKDLKLLHLPGSWARERNIQKVDLHYGGILLDSKRGASSHNENPAFALVRPDTTETHGDAYGFCLCYSGNFAAEICTDQYDFTRVCMGINPFDFAWELAPGESFQTPEAILVYSDRGLGEMTRIFHRLIRKNLCRGKFRDLPRPVLCNNWEATYFHFNEETILTLAAQAKAIGVELMVLDDGWFGKRDIDNCSLGDWTPDLRKLPQGLKHLADQINAMGMQFGLWFEPEMISENSDLYRAHPDWCIHTPGRSRTPGRNQLILDMARPEVYRYVIDAVSAVLSDNPISYVKWDMNRNMTEAPYPGYAHRYMLGLYSVLEEVTSRFPNILFESCSGGGGRFDAGMLYYMPQVWTSDGTDAVDRLSIQEGTGLIYPISTMGAHVSAVPNHQTGRTTPMTFRSRVAMLGRFGLELDLGKVPQKDLDALAQEIAFYKKYQQIIHQGDLYRLRGTKYDTVVNQILSEDKNTVMVFVYNVRCHSAKPAGRLQLQALDADAIYSDVNTGISYEGATLMGVGIPLDTRGDTKGTVYIFQKQ